MTMTFPKCIRKIRRDLDMSQKEMAEEINVSFASIKRWENKQVSPGSLAKKRFIDFCVVRDIPIPQEILSSESGQGDERLCLI